MYYGITVVVSFHPLFITKVDQAYHVKCFFEEANKGLTAELGVRQARRFSYLKFLGSNIYDYNSSTKFYRSVFYSYSLSSSNFPSYILCCIISIFNFIPYHVIIDCFLDILSKQFFAPMLSHMSKQSIPCERLRNYQKLQQLKVALLASDDLLSPLPARLSLFDISPLLVLTFFPRHFCSSPFHTISPFFFLSLTSLFSLSLASLVKKLEIGIKIVKSEVKLMLNIWK